MPTPRGRREVKWPRIASYALQDGYAQMIADAAPKLKFRPLILPDALHPHPEEHAQARVSKDREAGLLRMAMIPDLTDVSGRAFLAQQRYSACCSLCSGGRHQWPHH